MMKAWMRLVFVAALVVGLALADKDGKNGRDDGWGNAGDAGREVSVQGNSDTVRIRGTQVNNGETDAVLFQFSTLLLPNWVVSYFSKDSDSAAATSSRWSLWKLVEYTETGAAAGFQPEQDTIENEWRLWGRKWSPMSVTKSQVDNATVYSFCTEATGVGNALPFSVQICNTITDRVATVNGTTASPNALKWSLEISNYPYQANNTHLALKAAFDSADVVTNFTSGSPAQSSSDALEISSAGGVSTGVTWTTGVDLTGNGCPATANVTRSVVYSGSVTGDVDIDVPHLGDNSAWTRAVQITYFSLLTPCQPSKIFWDPEFGVLTPTTQTSSAHATSIAVGFVMAVVALVY